jgi:hypothetical protein
VFQNVLIELDAVWGKAGDQQSDPQVTSSINITKPQMENLKEGKKCEFKKKILHCRFNLVQCIIEN